MTTDLLHKYLRDSGASFGWYKNITEFQVVEVKYKDNFLAIWAICQYDDNISGLKSSFNKNVPIDKSKYNMWLRNYKLEELGI